MLHINVIDFYLWVIWDFGGRKFHSTGDAKWIKDVSWLQKRSKASFKLHVAVLLL